MGMYKYFRIFRCSCCGILSSGDGYVFEDGTIFCMECISEMND